MDCRGYRSVMWPYLNDKLEDEMTYNLIEHVYECADCKDELKTQFMVSEGMKRLESGIYDFNLVNEYEKKLSDSMERLKKIRLCNFFAYSSSLILLVFSVLIIVLSLFF